VRVATATVVVLAVLLTGSPAASASQADLDRARRRANAAAAEYAKSQSRLARVQGELAALEARSEATRTVLSSLEVSVREVAIARFMRSGQSAGSEVEFDASDATASVRYAALARMLTAGSSDAIDAYRAASEDLEVTESRMAAAREEAEAIAARAKRDVAATSRELDRLQKLEAERIAREKAEAERRRRAAAASSSSPSRPPPSGGGGGSARNVVLGSGAWICPVQGPRAFSNDWGQPRSGGRRHQGTDILSPRGTPVVAPVSGVARIHNSGLGGKSFYLNGSDGNTYFGTHLDSYSGNSGQVAAGTVLGYVGNTGNARGGPTHLHFEIHPGGGGTAHLAPHVPFVRPPWRGTRRPRG
jgi:peptidoglycan LD-endopeptidase LytH